MNSDNGMILKEDFHEQWWIGKTSWWIGKTSSFTDSEDKNEDPFSEENIKSMKEMYNSLPLHEQVIARRLMKCLKTGQFPYMLQEPSIVSSKGRLKGAGNRKQDRALSGTQRNSSQFEYVEMKMKKEETTSKRKAKKLENEKNQKKMKIEGGEKAVVVCADVNDAYDDEDNEDDLEEAHCEADYGPLLPKYFYDISKDIDEAAYDQIINIRGDGFCGFRALAYQLFDNQDAFMQVKFAMRDRLVEVKNVYIQHFDNYDIDKLERIVTYGIRNEKQVYGTTAEVIEFEQESYVSKDECAIEELDSEFKVLNSQVGTNNNRWDENGVFNVSCARHGSVMRWYDIYKGEGRKYALAGLKHVLNTTPTDQKLTIMYDIVCACVGRFEHAFPELKESRHVKYGVPIFHAYAHSASCQVKYHPRYLDFAKTDGESVERFWSYADHFVSQVRSMTANNRKSTLIDLADHFNDLKMDALPLQIKQKWVKAKANIEAMNMNVATFNALAWQWREHVKHVSKKIANLNRNSVVAEMEEQLTEEDDEYKFLEAAYQSLVINQPG
ncbi:hypothetical protein G6F42_014807 [Rhizopus arrhizus]|nr:hypothetical protein G6F42_014807 [Rhizopus arrhizus]